jgi:hypothetical protein
MKKLITLICIVAIVAIVSCKKKDTTVNPSSNTTPPAADNYSSIADFFSKNNAAMQSYSINATTGGSFTTPQGTVVTIPANAFLTQSNVLVTGNVTIQFKDLYKKSDMFLSSMPTNSLFGGPLKSGGEFFIKAIANNSALILDTGKSITVAQPVALTGGLDSLNAQMPFVVVQDTVGMGWNQTNADSVTSFVHEYIFNLYHFNAPVDSGSWCNSDNSTYFSAYPQTLLTLHPNDTLGVYGTQSFLLFSNLSSMVHVYDDGTNFPYYFAPQGLHCTLVAVGVKNGKLYSSFVPITITANLTVNFSLTLTTTSDFNTALKALN